MSPSSHILSIIVIFVIIVVWIITTFTIIVTNVFVIESSSSCHAKFDVKDAAWLYGWALRTISGRTVWFASAPCGRRVSITRF